MNHNSPAIRRPPAAAPTATPAIPPPVRSEDVCEVAAASVAATLVAAVSGVDMLTIASLEKLLVVTEDDAAVTGLVVVDSTLERVDEAVVAPERVLCDDPRELSAVCRMLHRTHSSVAL